MSFVALDPTIINQVYLGVLDPVRRRSEVPMHFAIRDIIWTPALLEEMLPSFINETPLLVLR